MPCTRYSYMVLYKRWGCSMNNKKWAAIMVPRDTYEELVAVAFIEGRTIGGQLRLMFEFWKQKNLTKNDLNVLQAQILKNEKERAAAKKEALDEEARQELREAFDKSIIPGTSVRRRKRPNSLE